METTSTVKPRNLLQKCHSNESIWFDVNRKYDFFFEHRSNQKWKTIFFKLIMYWHIYDEFLVVFALGVNTITKTCFIYSLFASNKIKLFVNDSHEMKREKEKLCIYVNPFAIISVSYAQRTLIWNVNISLLWHKNIKWESKLQKL